MGASRHGFDESLTTEVLPDTLGYEGPIVRLAAEVSWNDRSGTHRHRLGERAAVGAAPGNDIVVDESTVSRLHAEFYLKDQTVWVRDLGSRNGTFIQSVQITDAKVPDGGLVRFGAVEMKIDYGQVTTKVEVWPTHTLGGMLGKSVAMRECFARVARIANDDSTVLIHGETGTGKELVARTIHELSSRGSQPFVVVDCGSLPENLLESELFGHVKGAFTGATHSRGGAFEEAEGGTIFLDEIGELPLSMQPKLLRVLESHTVRRIGETNFRPVNVRILSATHRDLRTMVNSGAFREDLYFRLAVLPVAVPPLRSRIEDISLLVESFLPEKGPISAELLGELQRRPWFGNVRELRNFVARARVLGAEDALAAHEDERHVGVPPVEGEVFPPIDADEQFREIRVRWLDHLEREYISKLLVIHKHNISAVSKAAGLDRTYVYRLMRKHDLT
ncbi:Response regulator of zinc sigma-54-dependent two-component system [Labilithrix luteola]|uniref:Response regulator of zinc sigma-54-dependent two-component system n=1 Tax=Labilithrix luteola TaxID=1391654 RepID=A0A0K1PRT6_9BACT|nr:sigma 54-interacting transcriptional regulator [Labilithrix luteola]AKU96106.1 Response regulator of zinc sigma-54-dependent two-component system [Labilithrix luteola]